MLILAISNRTKKPSRLARWLFWKIFPGIALIFEDPFEMDLTTIPLPKFMFSGEIIEPQTLKLRHEIKIIINPEGESHDHPRPV